MRIVKGKKGHKKIKYTTQENEFYKQNKKQILKGLGDLGVAKNRVKRIFFSNVKEEMNVNNVSRTEAMKKVIRSRTFTSAEENFRLYKEEVIGKNTKGQLSNIKKYLGVNNKEKLDPNNWFQTSEGWEYRYSGKIVLLARTNDSKEYQLIYE